MFQKRVIEGKGKPLKEEKNMRCRNLKDYHLLFVYVEIDKGGILGGKDPVALMVIVKPYQQD